ncbi:MAG: iron ABC transporter permease, partial [Actinomycetota bacterium]
RWLMGSLDNVLLDDARNLFAAIVVTLPALIWAVPRANALQLGDEIAEGVGVTAERSRQLTLVSAVLLTAAAISTVGPIGFVGLVGPHIARQTVGADLRRLLPTAALVGSALLLLADIAERTIELHELPLLNRYLPDEAGGLPVGFYTAFIGVPFFLNLLRRTTRT